MHPPRYTRKGTRNSERLQFVTQCGHALDFSHVFIVMDRKEARAQSVAVDVIGHPYAQHRQSQRQ